MKKLIFTVAIFACALTAQSQDKAFRFGGKIGANLDNLTGDNEDSKMKPGFHVGLVAEYAFTENLSIQPELVFSTQGAKEEFVSDGINFDTDLKLNYLNLPVLVKYNNL